MYISGSGKDRATLDMLVILYTSSLRLLRMQTYQITYQIQFLRHLYLQF